MVAGIATLRLLKAHPPYERLEQLAGALVEGLVKSATRSNVPVQINRMGSMLTVFFSETPIQNFAQAKASHRDWFARWAQGLRQQGILVAPSPFEALFLSTAHTEDHMAQFIQASRKPFRSLKRR
jgi:glutamate-1-semialdehyde 2,1-aminomutase